MKGLLPALLVIGLPAIAIVAVMLRAAAKRRARQRLWREIRARLNALGAVEERGAAFRWNQRVYTLTISLNPIFSSSFDVRLSTFCDSVLEFEVRKARHVPLPLPEPLRVEPRFRGCALDAPSTQEPTEYLLTVKEPLGRVFPERWNAFSKMHCELVLSANRFRPEAWNEESIRTDLEALAEMAKVPAWRRVHGGAWTYREGFEPKVDPWHWKPEQRARLPEGSKRWGVSCWYDNAYLNRALTRFLGRLAGTCRILWVTSAGDLSFLEHGFERPAAVKHHLVELDSPDMAIAADQYLDGEFFSGAMALEEDDHSLAAARFGPAARLQFHDAAIDLLPRLRFYFRRLYDDEFPWFSGEYEIFSARLRDGEVREALEATAEEFGARVQDIDRPFSFKLLREDRLDISF
ncbi:MAG: hypothetical protein HY716_15190 [Planctomycetes bacterium]|nr:hypothetical protein [Planctomycetota bacterium]